MLAIPGPVGINKTGGDTTERVGGVLAPKGGGGGGGGGGDGGGGGIGGGRGECPMGHHVPASTLIDTMHKHTHTHRLVAIDTQSHMQEAVPVYGTSRHAILSRGLSVHTQK